MGRMEYIAMKTEEASGGADLINGGLNFFQVAAQEIIDHLSKNRDRDFGTHLLKWVASFAAIWEVGIWVAFVFPQHFPELLKIPGLMIWLLVAAPEFLQVTLNDSWIGVLICLLIGCYLLQEHIRATSGFQNSRTEPHGLSNTAGIVLFIVYSVWAFVEHLIVYDR